MFFPKPQAHARGASFDFEGHGTAESRLDNAPLLVNITVDRPFEYRLLYGLTSLAMQSGGILGHCNGEIALFAFHGRGVVRFMEEVGYQVPIGRTLVSQRDSGSSVVNVRFHAGM